MNAISAFLAAFLLALGCLSPTSAAAQTQTYPCETVIQFGTGVSTNGAKLRPGTVSSPFVGLGTIFPNAGNTYVLTNPLAAWIDNSASADSQWIGPSPSTGDDSTGVYIYYLPVISPCAGARITGRYAASDNGAVRLNGAPAVFPTPANGATTWTAFTFNNLLSGLNRLEFLVTNNVGGRPNATGLRAELTLTATCCPCIELDCPADLYLTTCSNGAPANFSITGTNRCFTNLVINCSLAAATGIPVASGSVFPVGTNTVICNASDTAGHRTNCSFRVVVTRDTRPPEIRCPQDIVYLCRSTGTNVYFSPTATDDVVTNPVVTCVPPSGSFFPLGTNRVECEARDGCGGRARCTFNVLLLTNGFSKILQAGVADNFSPAGLEPTTPGPCGMGVGFFTAMPFDVAQRTRHLSHSFAGLPADISSATLTLHLKPLGAVSQDDVLRVGLQSCTAPDVWVWTYTQSVASLPGVGGVWTTNDPTTLVLNLAALPGGVNLLAQINASHRLEFAVGTDTLVDYARLEVSYCGFESTFSGVPYSLSHAYGVHHPNHFREIRNGITWVRPPWEGTNCPTVELEVGGADGVRLHFDGLGPDSIALCQPYNRISEFHGFKDPPTLDPVAPQFVIAAARATQKTRCSLSQPNNTIGKFVEVWDGSLLISRHFQSGPDDTAVDVPSDACLAEIGSNWGSSPFYWYFSVRDPVSIDLVAVGSHVSGQPGPVVTGRTVRFYYVTPSDITPKRLHFELPPGGMTVSKLALLRGDSWIEPYGQQQISISDAISWHALPHSPPAPSGVCTPAYGPWTLGLNGVVDFCNQDPLAICNLEYVDVNLVEEINFGGLRITPGPLGSGRIDNTVANSPVKSITLNGGPGGPLTLNGATWLSFEYLPGVISGSAGPQSFTVNLYPNSFVFGPGVPSFYTASSATFHSQPQFLGQFYQLCVDTTYAPKFSIENIQTLSQTLSPSCLTLACPTNVIVNATNESGAFVTFNPSGATRCGSNVVVTCEPPSGAFFPSGLTVVHCSAVDSQGSRDDCRFVVTVNPALQLRATALRPGLIELRWTGDSILEFKESLTATAPWREVSGRTEFDGAEHVYRAGPAGSQGFFRLRQP